MMLDWREREERLEARAAEFRAREISEPVFRAALFALRYRGDEIEFAVNANRPERRH